MNPLFENACEHDRDERAISSLCDRTGAPHVDVRALFALELDRLALSATVRSYLPLLAAANVYAALRRRGKRPHTEMAAAEQLPGPSTANDPSR